MIDQKSLFAELHRITTQNRAILINQGHYYTVDAFAWGFTRANGDPFVALYPARRGWKRHICKVYPHQLHHLPAAILNTRPAAPPPRGYLEPGDRDEAAAAGILHPCPVMGVITVAGQEHSVGTERRFYAVDWIATTETESASARAAEDEAAAAAEAAARAPIPTPGDAERAQARRAKQIGGAVNARRAEAEQAAAAAVARWAELYSDFNRLGAARFGEDRWDGIAAYNTERITGGRTSDPNKLTTAELERLIAGLNKPQSKGAAK